MNLRGAGWGSFTVLFFAIAGYTLFGTWLHFGLRKGDYIVGVGWVDITPHSSMPMAGFSSREHASTGVLQPLRVTATRIIHAETESQMNIISFDLIGVHQSFTSKIYDLLQTKLGIPRASTILFFSHTHSGPVVGKNLKVLHNVNSEEQKIIDQYESFLMTAALDAIQIATTDLEPHCTVTFRNGQNRSNINRRQNLEKEFDVGQTAKGPIDHTVSVLESWRRDGTRKSLIFGYAAHGTVLTTEYRMSNDWIGYARLELEQSIPGCTVSFVQGCAGDVNMYPRGSIENAKVHGKSIAASVLAESDVMNVLQGKLICQGRDVNIKFDPKSVVSLTRSTDKYSSRLIEFLKEESRRRGVTILKEYPFPFWICEAAGSNFLLIALSGEPVTDYSLRLRNTMKRDLFIGGYAGEVMGYIPSRQVVREGGYEAGERSSVLYGLAGRFDRDTEDSIISSVAKTVN